jgi:hypothetical protein
MKAATMKEELPALIYSRSIATLSSFILAL